MKKDLGYTRYPQTVEGEESRPPYGGIGVGVSTYSNHVDDAMKAIECITTPENQGVNAELTGNMPASAAGYDDPTPARTSTRRTCSTLFQESLDAAAPRTVTPYWSDISGATPEHLAPAGERRPATPRPDSTAFIDDVLHGRSLL